jgi:hypothetical protein
LKFIALAQPLIFLIASLSFVPEVNAENFGNKETRLDYQWAISLYGGLHASDTINDIITFDADYSDGNNVLVAALAREVYRYKRYLSFEIEGQAGRLFGDNASVWECVGLGIARWKMFPWDDFLDMSIAIGAGFSYYWDISQVEKNRNEEAQRLLGYLVFELTFGVPRFSRWDLLMRIHHRSGMGGVIGEGSSNHACIGLKYAF